MWSKGAAVGNAWRVAPRCPRAYPVRRRRIVHMSKNLPSSAFRSGAVGFGTPTVQSAVRNINCDPAPESAASQRSMWIASCPQRAQRNPML